MSKVTFSGIGITAMNGSTGNTTTSRNAYGPYQKNKPPTPTPTIWTGVMQVNFQTIHNVWPTLTDAQRNNWIYQATQVAFQKLKRSLGNVERRRMLMGFHYFMSTNLNILLAGGAIINDPPKPEPLIIPTIISVSISPANFDITTSNPGSGNWVWLISATRNLSPGRMSNNQTYVFIAHSGGITNNIYPAYVARIGLPVTGQKIFTRIEAINSATGQRAGAKYSMDIVA